MELVLRAVEVVHEQLGVHGITAEVARAVRQAAEAPEAAEAPADVVVDELVDHFAEYEHVNRLGEPANDGAHRAQQHKEKVPTFCVAVLLGTIHSRGEGTEGGGGV